MRSSLDPYDETQNRDTLYSSPQQLKQLGLSPFKPISAIGNDPLSRVEALPQLRAKAIHGVGHQNANAQENES